MFPLLLLGALMTGAAVRKRRLKKRPPEERERQKRALQVYEEELERGATTTRAVEVAKFVYRTHGGNDVAFIARLDALDPATLQDLP